MPKKYNCEDCHDTGWYGDNGPGIKGNREYVPCDCCEKGRSKIKYCALCKNEHPEGAPCPPRAKKWWQIGDLVVDEDGNRGVVVIRWNDGDICSIENDAAHPNPKLVKEG